MCATAFALVAMLTGCVETHPAAIPVMYRSMATPGAAVDQTEAADLLNGHRRLKGLAAMSPDPILERIAADAARELASRNQPDAIVATKIRGELVAAHVSTAHTAENLSGGYFTLADAFSGWRGAPRQERTISLPAATRFGIASAYVPGSKYTVYWALVVAGP
ncbi:Cysteine-rich secretory protein family protein [Rhizobiales bacterium GAS113]|nr:Cysteine-rich secretory protein family protein [Rhizobiales bacterium GAS113]